MLPESAFVHSRVPKPTGAPGKAVLYNRDMLLKHKYTEITIDPTTNAPEMKTIQKEHADKLYHVVTNVWYAYQDSSGTGCGKTFVSLETARRLGVPILVIGFSAPVLKKWAELACIFNVPVIDVISYDSLGGRAGCQPKHKLLVRSDEGSVTTFQPTTILEFYAKSGMLVIFDETQKVKNQNSTRTKAAQKIAKYVTSVASTTQVMSRIGCLSASPGDKEGECATLAKLLGIISQDKIFFWNIGTMEMELHGFKEIQALAELLDPEKTAEILERSPLHKKKFVCARLLDLFAEVIKLKIGAGMNLTEAADYANGFYDAGENSKKIKREIEKLRTATNFDGTNVNMRAGSLAQSQAIFGLIEKLKTPIMARLAREDLEADPKCQVVLFVNRLDTVDELTELLADFNPLHMTGKVKAKDRGENLRKFQADDDEYRLIISTVTTGSVGLDYDDKVGDRIRHMYLFPGYRFIDTFQATGRVNRLSTKSKAIIRFIWINMDGKHGYDMELKILDSMARSSSNARKMMAGESKVPFPGEYRNIIEQMATAA